MVSTISLVGTGRLGAPMAACMALRGFRVKAVDLDLQRFTRVKVSSGQFCSSAFWSFPSVSIRQRSSVHSIVAEISRRVPTVRTSQCPSPARFRNGLANLDPE
jgi:hypothetical protein